MTDTEDEIEVEEKTEFKFSELSNSAKQTALDAERYSKGYLNYDWWDGVYEDAVNMASILGIEISTTTNRVGTGAKDRSYESTDISFSGFSSQGDGACFEGNYTFKPDAVEKLTNAAPQDKELHRIATALGMLSITQRLLGSDPISCRITTSGRYSHSGTMSLNNEFDDVPSSIEVDLLQLMRDFADWIYKRLDEEHDHLMSDESVAGGLEDSTFDESGSVI